MNPSHASPETPSAIRWALQISNFFWYLLIFDGISYKIRSGNSFYWMRHIVDRVWYCDRYPVSESISKYRKCSWNISMSNLLRGTLNAISDTVPVGTDFDRQFLIIPGLRPTSGASIWIFPSTLYLDGSSVLYIVSLNLNFISKSDVIEQFTKSRLNIGNGSNGLGEGMCSLPSCANPW